MIFANADSIADSNADSIADSNADSIADSNADSIDSSLFRKQLMSDITLKRSFFHPQTYKVQSSTKKHALAAPFDVAYRSLRTIDGIDDFTSLLGQLLPQLGEAIASLTVLGVAIPFVGVGSKGAIDESMERFRDDYPALLRELYRQQGDILSQLEREGRSSLELADIKDLFQQAGKLLKDSGNDQATPAEHSDQPELSLRQRLAQSWPIGRPSFHQLSSDFFKRSSGVAGRSASPALIHKLGRYALSENRRQIERTDRNFSVAGASGMTGMTAGMAVAAGGGIAGIVTDVAPEAVAVGAAVAGEVLSTVAGAVFLPAQIAMAAYGASKLHTGLIREQMLDQDTHVLGCVQDVIGKEAYVSVREGLLRERYYNKHHSISYGALTVTGQSLMAAGNIANFSGAGVPVGVALSAVGAPLTVAGAIERAVYESKERKFVGEDVSASSRQWAKQHNNDTVVNTVGMQGAIFEAKERYLDARDELVLAKLHGLILRAAAKENRAGAIYDHVLGLLRARGLSALRTGLLRSDLIRMEKLFLSEYPREFFTGSTAEVREKLLTRMLNTDLGQELALSDAIQQKVVEGSVKDLQHVDNERIKRYFRIPAGQNSRVLSRAHFYACVQSQPEAREAYHARLAAALAKQMKTDSKFLRRAASHHLLDLIHGVRSIAIHKAWVEQLPPVSPMNQAMPATISAAATAPQLTGTRVIWV
ncbi:hypothetical protein RGU70_14335 [Herbaspirillum sp. RTI4]|uniref:hypothetical protein n=1 Tax=Herbaspirillum sp. RTI4 TaxID=3048640 RepID=UPI002AB4426C|nr:hypothetical protein [Herbaspirillum sp. RTI4]MDY7579493.1 hypothetical protein [Herbaspirillum sp. RTI4]MEA9980407.1 hypothetical protein [Herbaspirillum sp. RTI4]